MFGRVNMYELNVLLSPLCLLWPWYGGVSGHSGLRQQVSLVPLVPVVSGITETIHSKYNTRLTMGSFSPGTYSCPAPANTLEIFLLGGKNLTWGSAEAREPG